MQGGALLAGHLPARAAVGPQLVDLDTCLQHLAPVLAVVGVHGDMVGGSQGIGDKPDTHPLACHLLDQCATAFPGQEVGGENRDTAPGTGECFYQRIGNHQVLCGARRFVELVRRVGHHPHGRRVGDAFAPEQLLHEFTVDCAAIGTGAFARHDLPHDLSPVVQSLWIDAAGQFLRRQAQWRVPEAVEAGRQFIDYRPGCQHLEIIEVVVGLQAEILGGDVATAKYRQRVIDDKGLVVHAPVGEGKIAQQGPEGGGLARQWIEQADLDIGVGGEGGQYPVIAGRKDVVQQQANLHTAVGRCQQFSQEQATCLVGLDQEILGGYRLLGLVQCLEPGTEAIQPALQ